VTQPLEISTTSRAPLHPRRGLIFRWLGWIGNLDRDRRRVASLSDHLLRDMGITRHETNGRITHRPGADRGTINASS
jgi:uncharacterized protein YjiS (DUF1127 family)